MGSLWHVTFYVLPTLDRYMTYMKIITSYLSTHSFEEEVLWVRSETPSIRTGIQALLSFSHTWIAIMRGKEACPLFLSASSGVPHV